MRYAWDQEHAYFPRRRGVGARLRGVALSALRAWDVAASSRVDSFVANSRFVAERIARYYRRRAAVIHPPVDVGFFTPGAANPAGGAADGGDYALVVTALAPYKRVEVAIAACERLGLELRVVGTGPEHRVLARRAGAGTRLLGRVGGETLRELYRGARCLVQPGVEDFGIAPVEALACGTPVVALGRGGVLDVVEDGVHGVLVPGGEDGAPEPAALAAAIDKTAAMFFTINDLRNRAEVFSTSHFLDRFSRHLEAQVSARKERSA
jgi:glycosyltransferase involved in cell wall biosynthesis